MKLVGWSIRKLPYSECDLFVERGFLWWKRREQWRGWCTIWRRYPDARRGDIFEESELDTLWKQVVW